MQWYHYSSRHVGSRNQEFLRLRSRERFATLRTAQPSWGREQEGVAFRGIGVRGVKYQILDSGAVWDINTETAEHHRMN